MNIANDGFWSVEKCADHLDVDPKHFRERIAVVPGFPKSVKFPAFSAGAIGKRKLASTGPRWLAEDVKQWARKIYDCES